MVGRAEESAATTIPGRGWGYTARRGWARRIVGWSGEDAVEALQEFVDNGSRPSLSLLRITRRRASLSTYGLHIAMRHRVAQSALMSGQHCSGLAI